MTNSIILKTERFLLECLKNEIKVYEYEYMKIIYENHTWELRINTSEIMILAACF